MDLTLGFPEFTQELTPMRVSELNEAPAVPESIGEEIPARVRGQRIDMN